MTEETIKLLIKAVRTASEEVLKIYAEDFAVEIKPDHSPVTIADKLSSKILVKALSPLGIPIISEEEEKMSYKERENLPQIWLIDPVDGTKEFIKKNDQFCINIALVENGKATFGMIASPTESRIIFGGKEIGAFEIPYTTDDPLNEKWRVKFKNNNKNKVIIHSNGGFSGTVVKFVRNLELKYGPLKVIKKGSALKFFDLVRGTADFYIRLAPTMEWDIAAGQAIYEAVGGEVLHIETLLPLTYNKPQLKNPYFLAKKKNLTL
ncbi:3'(2'),5'-bisphosphate nucleotidase CysQ [Putridiphycobacter roseus]|uniref:3'(2'),5'-bisphosphate nucleotidase CysQ n=1 Tax=Putridiphycobacter roseus TaxID=2219161 RepID=A0A2W1N0H2_9FLAO|nr:3'(2'),5'-bisphosphate nucleotidase CysQ [Putridiphycobacter roseus]PZE17000.1 3'(2'),5'-bisphosphate nucleotidase CysQ [Putridiphycobacter roseus]